MSEFTKWFPASVKPVRDGVYEVDTPPNIANHYAYYDHNGWRLCARYIDEAALEKDDVEDLHESSMTLKNAKWRGLAKKP
jgi:hypothetical protein